MFRLLAGEWAGSSIGSGKLTCENDRVRKNWGRGGKKAPGALAKSINDPGGPKRTCVNLINKCSGANGVLPAKSRKLRGLQTVADQKIGLLVESLRRASAPILQHL